MHDEVRELDGLMIKSCKVIHHISMLLRVWILLVLLLVALYDFIKTDITVAIFVKVFEYARHLFSFFD